MKKIIFYVAAVFAFFMLINIASILISDFSRLTEYGFGYLAGKVILFFLFAVVAFFLRKEVFKPAIES
ncbi:hypothetical protein QSV08_16985 [Maribacter sp. BPC-D8]|uniref:hypothetical protein n=1 Tax=Maribacter sp. BPC-D8 TaxID=3053613 RepID=UPI002B4875DE|nr:hypothetical protein [Maribacter sp. BPC-D8]WRI28903.1 hypothetical protein QSV08_16985 [Maribacter sp. BPC-D8]